MEKQFNREDKLIKKLLNEAGTEKPSADFKKRIMMRIEARNAEIRPYEPLISISVWIGIVFGVIIFIAGVTYLNSDISFPGFNFDIPNLVNIPDFNLSRTMQIAFGFVSLFFLQVPFLKRFLDREYQL